MIDRRVTDGRIEEEVIEVWLVLEEKPISRDGYQIIFNEKSGKFGLASPDFSPDSYPCLCGWYGDFMTTMKSM